MKERQAEVDSQAEVQQNTIAVEQIRAETDPQNSLDKLHAFLSGNEIIKQRKKGPCQYTREQLEMIAKLEERTVSAVNGLVKASFASNLRSSFLLCAEALDNDGHVRTSTLGMGDVTALGQGEKGMQGTLTKDMIQTLMVPEAILQHSVWSTVSSGCGCLARCEATAISMSNVMLALLSQSKA